MVQIGDIVTVTVIDVWPYASWGIADGQICFTHCGDWSDERPVPDEHVPEVGQSLRAQVFYVVAESDKPLRPDVSQDGRYDVAFGASFALARADKQTDNATNVF